MDILVSGAGMAGLSAAVNLGTRGHRVTIVERSTHFRVNGSPIDIRGDALGIAERMGLLERIRDRRVDMTEQSQFIDGDGNVVVRVPVEEAGDSADDLEIAREDLARILADALPADARVLFQDSVDAIADDGDGVGVGVGVGVRFVSGRAERYDLVIGADGLHSAVRRLVFGPERDFNHHLGYYAAIADMPGEEPRADRVNPIYNYPGHLAGIVRYNDTTLAIFMFRSDPIDYDHHDLDAQKDILAEAFAGHTEWRIPDLLAAARADPELYFDSASQIRMPSWHRGRVVLVGDAAHAASGLSGRGTSLAFTGTHILAEELDRSGGDHLAAFERYEERQRPYVDFAQHSVHGGADLIVPATWEAIRARNERVLASAGSRPAGA
ncbi:FAD-dependent monooxygenase [Dactylosporangium sp. CA-092794]|uniref:FAD-dependent monooxygenase n=1 Tax=Dactylosporangium sp. CA-092794 TaxID=3239929 RepID=UPI003D8C9604